MWKQSFISSWFRMRRHLTNRRQLWVFSLTQKGRLITPPMTPCVALAKHGVDYTIIQWIRTTLEGQLATETLGGFSRSVEVSRGCPQGGVFSPLLWHLVVGELIASSIGVDFILKDMQMTCLLMLGKFPNTISRLIQWAIHTVEMWCDELGL